MSKSRLLHILHILCIWNALEGSSLELQIYVNQTQTRVTSQTQSFYPAHIFAYFKFQHIFYRLCSLKALNFLKLIFSKLNKRIHLSIVLNN